MRKLSRKKRRAKTGSNVAIGMSGDYGVGGERGAFPFSRGRGWVRVACRSTMDSRRGTAVTAGQFGSDEREGSVGGPHAGC